MLRVLTCFKHCGNCGKSGDSTSISVARLMWIQIYEKTKNNLHPEQFQKKHHLMIIVIKKTLNVNKVGQQ